MPVVTCQSCAKRLKFSDKLAGKKVRCPGCGVSVAVPRLGAAPLRVRQTDRTENELGPDLVPFSPKPSPPADDPTGQQTDPPRAANDQTIDGVDADRAHLDRQLTEILAPAQGPGEIGRLGTFRVLKILGHGGMGVVYQAEDVKLQRSVAIKAILPSVVGGAAAGRRFLREARSMAQVQHPHVARIYQVDEDRGMPFLAMEFLKGESLEECLKRDKRLHPAEVVRIGREIAEGLAAAHETGLIHRDIKPGNIWLEGPRRSVKILDFGLARAESEEGDITQSGVIVGTPAYMAPEQGQGGKVDGRTDLFSLGVVLYRMVVGEMPFKGANSVALLLAVAHDDPDPPRTRCPETPEPLDALICRLLAKDPAKRYQSAAEVAAALIAIEWQGVGHIRATPPTPAPVSAPKAAAAVPASPAASGGVANTTSRRRNVGLVAAFVGACVPLAIVVMAVQWLFRGRPDEPIVNPDPMPQPVEVRPTPRGAPRFALRFDTKDKVGPFPFELDITQPFTLEMTVSVPVDIGPITYPLIGVNRVQLAAGKGVWRFGVIGQNEKFTNTISAPVTANVATPIAGVSTGKEMRFFVSGVMQKTKSFDADPPPDLKATLEMGYGSFKGIIREVRISRVARYDQSYVPGDWLTSDADTLALYHCDEGQGDILKDSSGNNRHARIVGAQWVKADGSPLDGTPPIDQVTPPIDEQQAKAVQATWAKRLGMSSEITHPYGLRFALIPPGTLIIGEKKKASRIPVTQPFYLGCQEVTVGQFRRFVKATGHGMKPGAFVGPRSVVGPRFQWDPVADWENPGWPQTPDHPVTCVSWNDAQAYCAWLTKEAKARKYRLPTDVEWEYACRAGTVTKYFFGFAGDLDRYGRHGPSAANKTHPVGELLPNPWGLYDVYGNVMEICQPGPETDPADAQIWRGGAWLASGIDTSTGSDYRFRGGALKMSPDVRCNVAGFRVLMELPRLAMP